MQTTTETIDEEEEWNEAEQEEGEASLPAPLPPAAAESDGDGEERAEEEKQAPSFPSRCSFFREEDIERKAMPSHPLLETTGRGEEEPPEERTAGGGRRQESRSICSADGVGGEENKNSDLDELDAMVSYLLGKIELSRRRLAEEERNDDRESGAGELGFQPAPSPPSAPAPLLFPEEEQEEEEEEGEEEALLPSSLPPSALASFVAIPECSPTSSDKADEPEPQERQERAKTEQKGTTCSSSSSSSDDEDEHQAFLLLSSLDAASASALRSRALALRAALHLWLRKEQQGKEAFEARVRQRMGEAAVFVAAAEE